MQLLLRIMCTTISLFFHPFTALLDTKEQNTMEINWNDRSLMIERGERRRWPTIKARCEHETIQLMQRDENLCGAKIVD